MKPCITPSPCLQRIAVCRRTLWVIRLLGCGAPILLGTVPVRFRFLVGPLVGVVVPEVHVNPLGDSHPSEFHDDYFDPSLAKTNSAVTPSLRQNPQIAWICVSDGPLRDGGGVNPDRFFLLQLLPVHLASLFPGATAISLPLTSLPPLQQNPPPFDKLDKCYVPSTKSSDSKSQSDARSSSGVHVRSLTHP